MEDESTNPNPRYFHLLGEQTESSIENTPGVDHPGVVGELRKLDALHSFDLSGDGTITGNVDNLPSSEFMLLQQVRIQMAGLKSGLEELKIKEDEAVKALSDNMKGLSDSMQRIDAYLEAEERRRNRPWWKKIFDWS